jgi:hypothetical protein
VIDKEAVNEDHAVVKELISADFTVEQSIDAVNRCGTLEPALDYLEQGKEREDKDEAGVIPVPQSHQFSMEAPKFIDMDR